MLSGIIAANCSEDESPDDPIIGVLWIEKDSFFDLLYRFGHFSFLKEGPCPMPVACVISPFWLESFCCFTNSDCFLIVLMHIVNESQVVIGIVMCLINLCAYFKMFNCHWIMFLLKVSEAKIVLQLGIIRINLTALLKSSHSLVIVSHLIQSNSQVKESFGRLTLKKIKLINWSNFKLFPIFICNHF